MELLSEAYEEHARAVQSAQQELALALAEEDRQ